METCEHALMNSELQNTSEGIGKMKKQSKPENERGYFFLAGQCPPPQSQKGKPYVTRDTGATVFF